MPLRIVVDVRRVRDFGIGTYIRGLLHALGATDQSNESTFAGTLTDNFLATALGNRPGCANAVAAEGGAPIASGTAWSAIFPNNQVPTQCFDPTAAALMGRYVPLPNNGFNTYQSVVNQSEKG